MKKENLILVKPSDKYADEIKAYRQSFIDAGDSMDGAGALRRYEDPYEYIKFCETCENPETVSENWVQTTQFFLMREDDQKILGMIQVRHYFNEMLEKFGGHIGYSIRPDERKKGYGKIQLEMVLPFCKEIGLDKVLITCGIENIGSEKIIRGNGGEYENTVCDTSRDRYLKRFWISL